MKFQDLTDFIVLILDWIYNKQARLPKKSGYTLIYEDNRINI